MGDALAVNWAGPAIVLSSRAHGEGAAIVQLFSREQGRYAGLVHGRRRRGAGLQPGALVEARWRARLEEHLGVVTLELKTARTGAALEDRTGLAGLSAACAVAESALPERDPHPAIYDGLDLMLSHLGDRALWPALYVRWELGLLAELGFGVRLAPSPSGGANLRDGAREFPVPRFLAGGDLGNGPSWADIAEGLALTGHFLGARLYAAHNAALPDARMRLMGEALRLAKSAP